MHEQRDRLVFAMSPAGSRSSEPVHVLDSPCPHCSPSRSPCRQKSHVHVFRHGFRFAMSLKFAISEGRFAMFGVEIAISVVKFAMFWLCHARKHGESGRNTRPSHFPKAISCLFKKEREERRDRKRIWEISSGWEVHHPAGTETMDLRSRQSTSAMARRACGLGWRCVCAATGLEHHQHRC